MGYITPTSSLAVTAYLTQKGRELLLSNKSDFEIMYFALGDSDANYKVLDELENGYVPDISGDYSDCIKSIANNIDIKSKVIK